MAGGDQLIEKSFAYHHVVTVVVSRGVAIAIAMLSSLNGVDRSAVVGTGGDFEVLIGREIWEMLGHRMDVRLDQIRSEREQRSGVRLVTSRVSRLPSYIVLNIDLNDANSMVLPTLKIAEDVLAIRFPAGDGEEVGGWKAVGTG